MRITRDNERMERRSQSAASANNALERIHELEAELAQARSELLQRKEELECARRLVSHDLRAPLRSIDAFSQIFQEELAAELGDEALDHLKRVRRAVGSMTRLLDDALTLLRPLQTSGSYREVDLSQLARRIVEDLRNSDSKRQVTVHIAENLTAQCDARLVDTLLFNLLDNAWKFTAGKEDVKIEFDTLTDGTQRVYFVRDNGAGFDMRYIDKLFQPFQRLHSTSHFPGNGIGLAIAQRIVRYHGGRIWAEAEVGHGTTFYFTLQPPG